MSNIYLKVTIVTFSKLRFSRFLVASSKSDVWEQNCAWLFYYFPHTVLERRTLCSYEDRKLNVKLWWIGARKRKKRIFFVPFILSEGNFFKVCVLSPFIVYWIHFQNIYILLHIKKHYFIHFRCLFLKSSKAFNVSLIEEKKLVIVLFIILLLLWCWLARGMISEYICAWFVNSCT